MCVAEVTQRLRRRLRPEVAGARECVHASTSALTGPPEV
jgi:hypothetical protein